uniref:HAUS augmin-like complex subunit 2 n=1 Tax=Centroberyx gerrardi TaxID=166262 RepID=UPI003AB0A9D2
MSQLTQDLCVFSVSPAASLLVRCVSRGALSQEEIDSASGQSSAFSPQLLQAEQQIQTRRRLDELQLQMELLQAEKESADITHPLYLSGRFQVLQRFSSHLQQVLQEQVVLRQRLMRPLAGSSLPLQAELHRCVCEAVKLLLDFIGNLEEKLSAVRSRPAGAAHLDRLNASLAQLLAQVVEVENLSYQVLQWKEVRSSLLTDSSA